MASAALATGAGAQQPAAQASDSAGQALLPASAGPASSALPDTVPVDRIVAVVGTQPILLSDLRENVNAFLAQDRSPPRDSAALQALSQQVLTRLVDDELLVQQAKSEKVEVTDNEVTAAVDQQVARIRGQFPSDSAYAAELRRAGFGTPEEYRSWITERQRRQMLQQALFTKLRSDGRIAPAPVSDAEVEAYFNARKGQLATLPPTVTFRQIVVAPSPTDSARVVARAKAESLLVEIRAGGDFAQIAKRESMDESTRELGGDLGWRRRGEFVPEFDQMAFSLRPGQVSPVVQTTFGYHIIKVDRVQPGEIKVRHILIRPTIDSADVARAQARADTVAQRWRAGAPYDSLVAKYHDPLEEKATLQAYPRDSLPASYQQAIAGKQAGAITDPFQIPGRDRAVPKFVVLQLTDVSDARPATVADYREQIRSQIAQERGLKRYLETLRARTYVSIRM